MLANLDRGNAMSRHRVGLALPVGMRGQKPQETERSGDYPESHELSRVTEAAHA